MFDRLKQGLKRTKDSLKQKIVQVVKRSGPIGDDFYDDLEEALLLADVGSKTASDIIERVKEKCKQDRPADQDSVLKIVIGVLEDILTRAAGHQEIDFKPGLNVIMVMGVNGTGKTTSIGKLAAWFKNQGKNVMIAACDTFRAAAVDQLEIWAKRTDVPIIMQKEGTDPSAVMYDAVQAAKARNIDILIADTAGRLHTQVNLMRELQKIRRIVVEKSNVESLRAWLVLDSTIGQNSLSQVKQFNDAVAVDGLVLTKLDGTARGGIVFSIVNEMNIPIVFVGVGEQMGDLMPFDPTEFSKALLGDRFDEPDSE